MLLSHLHCSFWTLFFFIFAYRLCISVSIISYIDPDEYWQSLEIAHLKVFDYGYCTWEWRHKIRSSGFPWVFIVMYSLLRHFHLDEHHFVMWLAPKVFMSLSMACADYFTFMFAKKWSQNDRVANWTLIASLLSSFHFIYGTRTLSNSLEMSLTVAALYYFPWQVESVSRLCKEYQISLIFIGLACMIRPTNALICIFLILLLFKRLSLRLSLVLICISLVTICAFVALSLILDFVFYEEWIMTAYRFFHFNVVQNISSFYGVHSFLWYFYGGLPFLLVAWIPFFMFGCYVCARKDLVFFIFGSLLVHSFLGHKEFRFLYPILPSLLLMSGYGLAKVNFRWPKSRNGILFTVCLVHVGLGLFFNRYHNAGLIPAVDWLREDIQASMRDQVSFHPNVFFLMPCHSTPYYSSLHINATLEFLTCEPPIPGATNRLKEISLSPPAYEDEADSFYSDPEKYIVKILLLFPNVNYMVLFENLYKSQEHVFKSAGFEEKMSLFNAFFHGDRRRRGKVMILKRDI